MDAEQLCVIEWIDAFVDTDDFNRKNAAKTTGVHRKTVGWYVCEVEEGVVLATDVYDKKSDGFSAKLFVPWGMIKRWYVVEFV
jgi:hypothetical protein